MFSVLKKRLRNMLVMDKEQVAKEVSKTMHSFDQGTVDGFFRRSLENMKQFYFSFNRDGFLAKNTQ